MTLPATTPARHDTPLLRAALAVYTLSIAIAVAVAVSDDPADPEVVLGGSVFGVAVITAVWYFSRQGHVWPRWLLLVVLVVEIAASISLGDARSTIAVLEVTALVLLLLSWRAPAAVQADGPDADS